MRLKAGISGYFSRGNGLQGLVRRRSSSGFAHVNTLKLSGARVLAGLLLGLVACATTPNARPAPAPPPPPCAEASQYARARAPVAPDSVFPPMVTRISLLPNPPEVEQWQNPNWVVTISVRVDSIGNFDAQSITITGTSSVPYRKQLVEYIDGGVKFRPASLAPDGCSVPGIATVTLRSTRR
jgi:hypothetical protein